MKVIVEGPEGKLLKVIKVFRNSGFTIISEDGTVLAAPRVAAPAVTTDEEPKKTKKVKKVKKIKKGEEPTLGEVGASEVVQEGSEELGGEAPLGQ